MSDDIITTGDLIGALESVDPEMTKQVIVAVNITSQNTNNRVSDVVSYEDAIVIELGSPVVP